MIKLADEVDPDAPSLKGFEPGCSVPHVPFVVRYSILFKEGTVLVLKSYALMNVPLAFRWT
jgi:hypothetical protein